ncbi:hypothetical protein DFH28DRAFT_451864 [Melampsora americana]|nr:hypothetical protein DFH28DRAFT_451864 [Melampsora americana]
MNQEQGKLHMNDTIFTGNNQKLDELVKIHPNELFAHDSPIDDDNLVQGRLLYQNSKYMDAIKSYTKVIESITKLKAPIPRDLIKTLGIALSNNVSCKLIMNDHRSVIEGLEKSIGINLIFLNTSFDYQKLTITQILQLFKSYITLFKLNSARQLCLRVQKDSNLLKLINQTEKSRLEFRNLIQILNWLISIEKKIHEFKDEMRWDLVNQYFKILENQIKILNLNDSIEETLPSDLEMIKAESLAWLGYPEEAELIANQRVNPVDFDTAQQLWLRGLISFSYGNLQESLNQFERLHEIKKDSFSTGTMNRVKSLLSRFNEVKRFSMDQDLNSLPKMTELVRHFLRRIGQYPIEQTYEDQMRFLYIQTCFNKVDRMTDLQEIGRYIQEAIKFTNEILSSKILAHHMNSKAPMIPIRFKKLLLNAFLYKSRIWAYKDYNLPKSIEAYSHLIYYLKSLDGYNLLFNSNMSMIEEEVNRVKMRCEFLNQYLHYQQQLKFNIAVNQAQISKEKDFEEALRLAKTKLGYYKVLGLKKNSCQREIRSAFKKLSLEIHPDKGGLTKHFQLLNEIHSTLSDRIKRHNYDNYQKRIK